MKKYTWLLVAAFFFVFIGAPAFAAPLFGDVPDEHWARDAVANLAAKGLVEGYPDGTFKGDRAATRYELAMVVARFLAKNDQEHATFATKADLEELRKLVNQLKDELDALGVRVTNLEENVSKLDKRVTELERITFYGEIDSILITQGFTNNGQGNAEFHQGYLNAVGPTTFYAPWTAGADTLYAPTYGNPYFPDQPMAGFNVNGWMPTGFFTGSTTAVPTTTIFDGSSHMWNQLVGYQGGANLNPFFHGVFPVSDYRTGRPLTNGTGFSMKAMLGINAKINDEIDGGLELAAYTSMGDPVVDAFYGVSAPYLTNGFTNNGMTTFAGVQGQNMQPWTRMVLDNFWVKHKTSGIKLIGGSFGELNMEPLLYAGEPNPNINGPEYLNNYGFRVFGTCHFLCDMDWEVFWTRLADQDPYRVANAAMPVSDYYNWAYGVDFNWRFGGGNFKLGLLRAVNDYVSSAAGQYSTNGINTYFGVGQLFNPASYGSLWGSQGAVTVDAIANPYFAALFPTGTATSTMSNPFGWVNPSGWYTNQLAGGNPFGGVIANSGWQNQSPIYTSAFGNGILPGNSLGFGNDGTWGGYGPQETTNWNAKFSYKWDPSQLRFFIEYASSTWKPNMESSFSRTGGAGRAGLGATLAQGKLDLDLTYKIAQAWYDPFTLRFPTIAGVNQAMWRYPMMSYYPGMYQLHDSDTYPNNRRGWKFKVTYRFPDEKGKIWAYYEGLEQDNTSVYDVRYFPGSISGTAALNWVPNNAVFGYTPGFLDPVFTPYAMGTYYGWNSFNPGFVNAWGAPLEDPRGKVDNWAIGADYKFPESGFVVDANYYDNHFKRSTSLVVNGLYNLGSGNWNVGAAPSANNIDLAIRGFHIGLQYPFNERFTGRIGYDYANFVGHYDPNNLYWIYAVQTGSSGFTNVDTQQSIPYLGFDYKLNKNTEWGLNVQFFTTTDRVGSSLQPTLDVTGTATNTDTWRNSNPFSWNGIQIMTEFKVKF